MERKLKERLVGASLLIVAGVIVLPWLLDGRVAPQEQTQSLALPRAGGAASTTRKIVLDGGSPQPEERPATARAPTRQDPGPSRPAQASESALPPAAPASRPAQAAAVEALDAEPAPAGDPAAGWAVQVGSFSSQSNARKLAAGLTDLGYRAFVSRKVIGDRVMYRVRVGPQRTRDEAAALAKRLEAEQQPVRIVEHPG